MTVSFRQSLEQFPFANLKENASHPGLWFDKFLKEQTQRGDPLESYQSLVEQCSAIKERANKNLVHYQAFYDRWLDTLFSMNVTPYYAHVNGRLTLGLGNASIIETGTTIHHTYGVPYIPGSSLKGTAASYAHNYLSAPWQVGKDAHNTLFGSQDGAGFVTFFDALPVPGDWNLLPDVITVHHPNYYRNQKDAAPADWDNPTPLPFLSVTGKFVVALAAHPSATAWLDPGIGILRMALIEIGIGAKTSSGYGRMRLEKDPLPPPFVLKEGAYIRTLIEYAYDLDEYDLHDNDEQVLLELNPTFMRKVNFQPEKAIYAHICKKDAGNRSYQEGQGLACIVLQIQESEQSITLRCRPATKSERDTND